MNTSDNATTMPILEADSLSINPLRKTALAAGICYLLTFVSIPTIVLYGPIHHSDFSGTNTPVLVGGILEIIVALAGMGTAIALYPVLKKQNEALALGFVASRTLEAGAIFAGVAFLLTAVSMHQSGALVELYDKIFLIGQSFIPAVNGLLLGTLLYRARLVPRVLPLLGFAGAVLLLTAWGATLFGVIGRVSPAAGLLALPVAAWEFSLGLYLVIKGFKTKNI